MNHHIINAQLRLYVQVVKNTFLYDGNIPSYIHEKMSKDYSLFQKENNYVLVIVEYCMNVVYKKEC